MPYIRYMKIRNTTTLTFRLPRDLKESFYAKAALEFNHEPADVLRRLMNDYLTTNKENDHDHRKDA